MAGIRDIAREVVEPLADVVDEVHTSDEERAAADREFSRPVHQTNTAEAGHASVFVAGWRPFIGWVLGVALAHAFIIRDLLNWAFAAFGWAIPPLPVMETADIVSLILAMLGLSTQRMIENRYGVARQRIMPADPEGPQRRRWWPF